MKILQSKEVVSISYGREHIRHQCSILTIINSYSGIITKQEDYEYVYSFGDISQEDAKNMRTVIENVLDT